MVPALGRDLLFFLVVFWLSFWLAFQEVSKVTYKVGSKGSSKGSPKSDLHFQPFLPLCRLLEARAYRVKVIILPKISDIQVSSSVFASCDYLAFSCFFRTPKNTETVLGQVPTTCSRCFWTVQKHREHVGGKLPPHALRVFRPSKNTDNMWEHF